jgi:hypothetical protein
MPRKIISRYSDGGTLLRFRFCAADVIEAVADKSHREKISDFAVGVRKSHIE